VRVSQIARYLNLAAVYTFAHSGVILFFRNFNAGYVSLWMPSTSAKVDVFANAEIKMFRRATTHGN
jgi:hypothetical protein